MKAIVIDKKHLTLVSHTNGVTVIEESGCIIDLDYQCLTSICEISDIGNNYSIDSKFVISFKDTSIASKAFNELRYSISPRTVLLKYENDIIEYNVDAMNIYFIEANTPTVIRKFNDENFSITCCDVYTAEITNALLNCGFPASDIVSTYKSYIAFSNIN